MSLRPNERAEVRRNKGKMVVDEEGGLRQDDILAKIPRSINEKVKFKRLAEIVAAVYSEDKYIQLKAMTLFKKMLSKGKQQTVDDRTFYLLDFSEDIMKYGVVPRFVEFLARDDFPQLQFEAASALINITSGTTEDTQVVVDLGAVPIFVELLLSNSDDVKEMAVCALGNVAGDSPRFRDFVLANGALIPVLHLLNEDAKLSMLRTASLTLYNFFSGEPQPDFEETRPALPVLKRLIQLEDETVLCLACWALCCLSGGTNDQIQAVIDAGVCPKLVELLLHSSLFVVKPVLLTVISIVQGDGAQFVIDHHVLPYILQLTYNPSTFIKRRACLAIEWFTIGNKEQIQAVIDAGIITRLVQLLETNIKTEAIVVISNAASRGSFEHIKYLVSQGCIKALNDLLHCPDPIIVVQCICGLQHFLRVPLAERLSVEAGSVHSFYLEIEDARMQIERLIMHSNTEIKEMGRRFLSKYLESTGLELILFAYGEDDDTEDKE